MGVVSRHHRSENATYILTTPSNPQDDAPKLQYDLIKPVITEAASDILLLLDCCAVPESSTTTSSGVKQAVAACAPETATFDAGPNSFTYHLIDALHKLSSEQPFTAEQLHKELIISQLPYRMADENGEANGTEEAPRAERAPVFFNLTPNNPKNILLTPLDPPVPLIQQLSSHIDGMDGMMHERLSQGDQQIYQQPMSPGLMFDQERALCALSFPDEFGHEMITFKQWVNSMQQGTNTVTVEGQFKGPQTILIMSMPAEIYQAISNERPVTLLGMVKSHNMVKEHQSLVDLAVLANQASNQASNRHLEDGKMLLEAADALAAVSSPGLGRQEPQPLAPPNMEYHSPHMMAQPPSMDMGHPMEHAQMSVHKPHEDSDEMHEAAIQLKALSHVRPPSHDNGHGMERSHSNLLDDPSHSPQYHSPRQNSMGSQGYHHHDADSDMDGDIHGNSYASPASNRKPRRSLAKSTSNSKTDTRCSMCSHAPFKDSSSLRKHVAAAHTRPFPCAFAFAGCTSTFGSKNEWKRHIASQHLCLTYYRCSSCPQSQVEGKGNEFNRKDLFTQHLRRMHAPFAIKKALNKGDSKLQTEWESHVKQMQQDCLVHRRQPPQRSACPKEDCANVFEGNGSWDDWTEHVGRHMEKGEAGRLGVDDLLARWALDEGIIEMRGGEYRLTGGERESGGGNGGYFSDGQGRDNSMQGVKREADQMDGGDRIEEAVMLDTELR